MPRGKIQMSLIGDAQDRARTFSRRKKGLVKKAQELAKLCDIDVAVVVDGDGPNGGAVWESSPGVVIDRYRSLPAAKRAAHTHLGYLDGELRKETRRLAKQTAKRREEGLGKALLACPGEAALEGMDLERLLANIDAALLATAERQKALGLVAADDDGGQQVMPLPSEAIAPPVVVVAQGGGGSPPFAAGGGDDLDDIQAWVDELTWDGVEPLPLNAAGVTQPASDVMQYNNGNDMDMGGNGESGGGQLPWHAYQQPEAAVSFLDYGFQCTGNSYGNDMGGCSEMPVQSNASATWYDQASWGAAESSSCAVYPSLDIAGNAAAYMPSQHEHPGMGMGSFMDVGGHEYDMGCLADYLQFPDASQQHFGGEQEPVHYLSDMVQGIGYNDDLEASGCSSGGAQLFAQSHSCSGTLQSSGSEQSLSEVGYQYQDPGVQHFWVTEGTPGSTDFATASARAGGTWANTNSTDLYQPWISVYQ